MRKPVGSQDTSHVPAPDPESFWCFEVGKMQMVSVDPVLSFQINTIMDEGRISGTQILDRQTVHGVMDLDRPMVVARTDQGEPTVTLTVRKIECDKVYIQVTYNPRTGVVLRRQ